MIRKESVYRIGKVGKPHGYKGETTIYITDDVFDRTDAQYLVLEIDGILVPFFMEEYRFRSDTTVIMKFCDVDTEDGARRLTGCDVYFPREIAGESDDERSLAQIQQFTVVDANTHKEIGKIIAIDDSTANTLLEVSTNEGDSILIPVHDNLIANIDVKAMTVTMLLPEGLLEL